MATVKTMKAEDVIDKTEAPFNFALKIKLGALIYAMQSIEDAYENSLTNHFPINYVIKPENSDLYKLGREILKVEKLSDYPEEVRMSCLAAFKIYMNNAETLQAIAKEGTVSFQPSLLKDLQLKNEKLQQALVSMLAPYLEKNKISWNMLFAFAILGGYFIGGPLAYGMGEMFGTQMGELNQALDAKVWLSKNIITPIGAMHNFDQIGFLMSDQAVKDILGRFVAKLLEPVGMLVAGVALGGTVGLSLDLAYKGLSEAIKYLSINKDKRFSINELDLAFAKSLIATPKEVFSESKNKEIKLLAQELKLLDADTKEGKEEMIEEVPLKVALQKLSEHGVLVSS